MKIKNYTVFSSLETKNWDKLRNSLGYQNNLLKKDFNKTLNCFVISKSYSSLFPFDI